MNVISKIVPVISIALLSGCATYQGTVIPKPEGKYEVISTGSSKDASMKDALGTAGKTCTDQMKRHVILNSQTEYQGAIKEDVKDSINNVLKIANMTSKNNYGSASGDEDYKTTLEFICE